ncbi:hypothetical protein KC8_11840 [Sphingomonas sp. KC8]|nr:hypothetical protein KC8_11840 [Sphingomonas sp. KC8]
MALAGCVAPAPPPPPPPQPAPPPPPPPPSAPVAWEDAPLTPGVWSYARATARFGRTGQAPLVVLACDVNARRLTLSLSGPPIAANPAIIVTTSYGKRALPAVAGTAGFSAQLDASDGLLDWMAFSRGRIRIETAGAASLTLPAWAEVSRVVEDCRK